MISFTRCYSHGLIFFVSILVFSSKICLAARETRSEGPSEEVCIPASTVQELMTCPDSLKAGRFREIKRAQVQTSKKELEKKKVVLQPGFDRKYTQAVIESVFYKARKKRSLDFLKKELQLLARLAQDTPDENPEKADVLKRLADTHKNFFEQYNFLARELDEKIYQAKTKGQNKEAAKYRAQQKKLDELARKSRENGIKVYAEIRDNFPNYPYYDEILFAIGYEIDQLSFDLEDEEEKSVFRERAREFYQELIRNYPRSHFVPHAWMAYGEYYFREAKDANRALRVYQKVVEWGEEDNPHYVIARYYMAWCLFNMQEFEQTLTEFTDLVAYAEQHVENPEAMAVSKRARMELVDPYSKIRKPKNAWSYFQKHGKDLAHAMLVKLADIYYDRGQWDETVTILRKLEELELENYKNNNRDDLCAYQHKMSNAIINSRPKDEQLAQLKRQMKYYKEFAQPGEHDALKVKRCAADTSALVWDMATHWHLEAVGTDTTPGTGDKNTQEVAAKLYEAILETFPNLDELEIVGFDEKSKPTRYRVSYYIADLYWAMEDWAKCGPAFDRVAMMDPKGELTPEAAFGAVLCYNKVYAQEREKKDRTRDHAVQASALTEKRCDEKCQRCKEECEDENSDKCKAKCEPMDRKLLKRRELTEQEQGILRAYERYVCFVAQGEELIKIKYRRARIYYEANQFEEAAVLFKDIAVNHSDDELAQIAANLYLDCLNALGDMIEKPRPVCYEDLASIVDLFIDTTKAPGANLMKDKQFADQIKLLKVGVLRKKAEYLNAKGRFKETAEIYLEIYKKYRKVYDSRGMCEVLFNTAIAMEAARLVMPAIKVRHKMIELYPECEHSKKASFYIGQNYHALQVFPLASENYLTFAKKYPGEPEAPDALANAVTFYIGMGKYEEAWSAVRLFEKLYGGLHPQKAAVVFFGAGYMHLHEAVGSKSAMLWDPVRRHYLRYLKYYSKVMALDEQVQAHVFVGDSYWNPRPRDLDQAIKHYKKALAIFENKAMEKVTEADRKAKMLDAAAKARFWIAERKYYEFTKVKFPVFNPEKTVSPKIYRWWTKKKGKEEVERFEQVRKYRRQLANWGEMDWAELKKETRKEEANIQFEYWLERRFQPWMDRKSAVLKEANELFAAVVNMHVPEWEMAAAARAADMQMDFMNLLYDAPLPPLFQDDEELTTIYRQSMDEKAQPFRDLAVELYAHCLNVSTKIRWFNENSRRCEAALSSLNPRKYPVSEEIRVQPDHTISYWAIPGPIFERSSKARERDQMLTTPEEAMSGEDDSESDLKSCPWSNCS